MNIFRKMAAAAAFALSLVACAHNATPPSNTQQLYQTFIATPVAAGILASTGAALETTCVIKPGSPLRADVNTALVSISAALNAGNKVIQDAAAMTPPGDPSAASVGLNSAIALISTLQAQLAVLKVPPVAAQRMMAQTRAKGSSFGTLGPVIINLIIQNLPLIISSASALAPIIQGWIDSLSGGTSTADLKASDVQHAVDALNGGLASWQNASMTVCP